MAIDKSLDRDIAALRREGAQYLAAGMLDRVELVNAELRRYGADALDAPIAKRQTRQSTQATTRRKADS